MSSSDDEGYSSFYNHIALFPELGNFRRFGAFWAKKLHDESSELLGHIASLDEAIEGWPELDAKSVLDCPKRYLEENREGHEEQYETVNQAWSKYEEALMRYGKTLCRSERIMNLPSQDKFYTKKLAEWKLPIHRPLFDSHEFIPTGEEAKLYQGDASRNDMFAWRALPPGDVLTRSFLSVSPWIDECILDRWWSLIRRRKPNNTALPSIITYNNIVRTMDLLTCILPSVLLVTVVVVLKAVHPWSIRIALVGIFGALFALLLKLMAGTISRGEVFGATAAFYAVAVVFVSNTNDECART